MNWIKRILFKKEIELFQERELFWQRYYNQSQRDLDIMLALVVFIFLIMCIIIHKLKNQ